MVDKYKHNGKLPSTQSCEPKWSMDVFMNGVYGRWSMMVRSTGYCS